MQSRRAHYLEASDEQAEPGLAAPSLLARLRRLRGSSPAVTVAFDPRLELIATFEESGKGWFWAVDADGYLTYLSPHIARQLDLAPGQLRETPLASLIAEEGGATGGATARTLGFHFKARTPFVDVATRTAASPDSWWSLTGSPMFDEAGDFAGYRGMGSDRTEERRVDTEIERLAHYDALTDLPNRVLMRTTLVDTLANAKRAGGDCALFMLDLDRFKSVNDTLGHPVGDVLLQQVASRLVRIVGSEGRVCRLGGDEFTVIVPVVRERESLARLADTIITRLSYPYTINGSTISIGASVGIAISPFDGDCPDDLVRNADLALYAAKEGGKGIHMFYRPQMHSEAKSRRLLEIDLREALGRGELALHYQPLLDATTARISGFEALLRWNHPVHGEIEPAVFVPIAEEVGLIGAIGDWALRTALATAATWPEDVRVAVNISPLQFATSALPATVANALAGAGVAANRLELELTEGVFLTESKTVDSVFSALKQIGVRLSLDDFGTGYASLATLKRLPFDALKIDKSFVQGLSHDGTDRNFIHAIVALAHSLGMTTTAEGVETVGEMELVKTLGCTRVQGYILGKPMTGEAAASRLASEGAASVEQEREPRYAVLRRGRLHSDGRTHPVRVRNISSGGAMIEIGRDARIANIVELELSSEDRLSGTVRWVRDRRVGIAFDHPADAARLARGEAIEAPSSDQTED